MTGPSFYNTDVTLARSFAFGERNKLQLRGEVFNVFNHPNYRLIGRLINVPDTFGKVLNQFDPRQIQLAVKVAF